MQGLSNIVRKVQEKSPLKYPTVRQMACLDPSVMYRDPDRCKRQIKCLVQRFLQDKQLTGGVSAGRKSSGIGFDKLYTIVTRCSFSFVHHYNQNRSDC